MMRRFPSLGQRAVLALIQAAARAGDILEEDPGSWVAAMDPDAGGTVILRVDEPCKTVIDYGELKKR